jgi:hypothetical protein
MIPTVYFCVCKFNVQEFAGEYLFIIDFNIVFLIKKINAMNNSR